MSSAFVCPDSLMSGSVGRVKEYIGNLSFVDLRKWPEIRWLFQE